MIYLLDETNFFSLGQAFWTEKKETYTKIEFPRNNLLSKKNLDNCLFDWFLLMLREKNHPINKLLSFSCRYSRLSNKREVTLTDFEKNIHPPRLLISLIFSTAVYYSYVLVFSFQKIPSSTFIPTSSTIREMRVLR